MGLVAKVLVYRVVIVTLLLGGDLTADTRDVTVDARPAAGTLAGERRPLLPTRATVLTGRRVTPAHQTLKHTNIRK